MITHIGEFMAVADKVQAAADALDDDEIDDVPDEFQDPIMNTLMRDPVRWEEAVGVCVC
jgi:hypothetical protein